MLKCQKATVVIFGMLFILQQECIAQQIHYNASIGVDISRKYRNASSYYIGDDNTSLMPRFQWQISAAYRQSLWKRASLHAVGGLTLQRQSFYFPVRAENDYSSSFYENVNFNFYASVFSLGIHKTLDLYQGNVQLNFGLNLNWHFNFQSDQFKSSRDLGKESMSDDFNYDFLYPAFRPYEYRILVEQPIRNTESLDLQIDVFFKLNDNLRLSIGAKLPFMGGHSHYEFNAKMLLRTISVFPSSNPNQPPVPGYGYYNKSVVKSKYFWFATANVGLVYNIKIRK